MISWNGHLIVLHFVGLLLHAIAIVLFVDILKYSDYVTDTELLINAVLHFNFKHLLLSHFQTMKVSWSNQKTYQRPCYMCTWTKERVGGGPKAVLVRSIYRMISKHWRTKSWRHRRNVTWYLENVKEWFGAD